MDRIETQTLLDLGFRRTDQPDRSGYPEGCAHGWYRSIGRFGREDKECFLLVEPLGEARELWAVTIYEPPFPKADCIALPQPLPTATALRMLVLLLTDPVRLTQDGRDPMPPWLERDVNVQLARAASEDRPGWGNDAYEADEE